MWVYLILMVALVLLSCNKEKSIFKTTLSGIVLFLLIGLRGEYVGNDTINYIFFFNRMKWVTTIIDPTSRFEKGYQIYCKIIGLFFDYQIMFIITALICIGCILYGIVKNSKNWQYSLFLFVGLRFFYFFLSGIRQSIAVSLIFVAYIFLKQNKILKYVLLVILASTFHFSALIFLLAWPLSKIKFTYKNIFKILSLTLVTYAFFNPILTVVLKYMPNYYSGYLITEAASANNLANYIEMIIPILILLFAKFSGYLKEINVNNLDKEESIIKENSNKNLELFFLLISSALFFMATRVSVLDRIVQYYWIFSINTITNIIFSIKDLRKRLIWFLMISLLIIIYNIMILILRPEWTQIIPYKFFWQ